MYTNTKKKPKVFRPFKIPRYLPGSVANTLLTSDLREYNNHRYKVFTAETKTDHKPPAMNPYKYIDKQKMASDCDRAMQIDLQNRKIVRNINIINRTKGKVDSFNPVAYMGMSKWRSRELEMMRIEKQNLSIYNRLNNVESEYSRKNMEENWRATVHTLEYTSKYPLVIVHKKTIDQEIRGLPSISGGLQSEIQRPRCFMDFKVKDGVFLGRIIIELYFDYVPVTVQNFLAICRGENGLTYKNCPIHRSINGQFCDTGDITKGNGKGGMSIYGKSFDEENFSLKHSKPGVLSMIPLEKHQNNSQFSITFTNIDHWDGRRVVFGKIVKGNPTIFKISDLSRKCGRPSVPIEIINCGEFIKGETESKILLFKHPPSYPINKRKSKKPRSV